MFYILTGIMLLSAWSQVRIPPGSMVAFSLFREKIDGRQFFFFHPAMHPIFHLFCWYAVYMPKNCKDNVSIWLMRLLVGIVFLINVQCAAAFLLRPHRYTAGFGLTAGTGPNLVRSLGLLFLMWNVPYAVALINPIKYKTSYLESIVMQAIGLAGEIALLLCAGPVEIAVQQTVMRFIVFDAFGLLLLLSGYILRGKVVRAANSIPKK